jgi:hydrogenase maturation factor
MCLGSIAVLVESWGDAGTRVGRLDDGCIVPLSFVPNAPLGTHLLVHLGIPVEVLHPHAARAALALRAAGGTEADRNRELT